MKCDFKAPKSRKYRISMSHFDVGKSHSNTIKDLILVDEFIRKSLLPETNKKVNKDRETLQFPASLKKKKSKKQKQKTQPKV